MFQWAAIACRTYPPLAWLYAVPNAGRRSPRAGQWMKAEGLRAGVPDVCLPVPRGPFGALYIEHKRPGGKLTPEQERWHRGLTAAGNRVMISHSFDQTRAALLEYLALAA